MKHHDLMKRVKSRLASVRPKTIVRYTRSPRERSSAFDDVFLALAVAEKHAQETRGHGPTNDTIEFCEAVLQIHRPAGDSERPTRGKRKTRGESV